MLSRGVVDIKNLTPKDYYDTFTTFTHPSYLESWMDFDKLYLFKKKDLKINVENKMVPYHSILDLIHIKRISLLDTKKFTIRLDYENSTDFVIFKSANEIWKFYNYINVLCHNAIERQNSLVHDIEFDLRFIIDNTVFGKMKDLFALILENFNRNYNRRLSKAKKGPIGLDNINFRAISEFYDSFLTGFYCLKDYIDQFPKLKIFINKFHELYIKYIEEILKNQFSEVGL